MCSWIAPVEQIECMADPQCSRPSRKCGCHVNRGRSDEMPVECLRYYKLLKVDLASLIPNNLSHATRESMVSLKKVPKVHRLISTPGLDSHSIR